MEQFERNCLETAANEIAPHGVTHILSDDEAETNRSPDSTRRCFRAQPHIENGVRTNDSHSASYDALVITAARDAI